MYVCMYACMFMCVCVGGKTSILISEYHNYFDYDHHFKKFLRNPSQCHLLV